MAGKHGSPRREALCGILVFVLLCTGCASMLERQYSSVEPHSRRFWESEAAGTLRAETYADIVNDLLLLIGQHRESGTLRLYNFDNRDTIGGSVLGKATMEVQNETPMGSYAVSYFTFSTQAQRGYDEAKIEIFYKRTAEQMQAVVSATSPEAVYGLLESALRDGRTELAVRIGYWTENGRQQVERDVEQLRSDMGLAQTPPWVIRYHPESGQVGLIEFDLNPPVPVEEQTEENTAETSTETAEETEEVIAEQTEELPAELTGQELGSE